MDKFTKMKHLFLLFLVSFVAHTFAQSDTISIVQLGKPFAVEKSQKYKIENQDIYLQIKDITTEADLKPAQLKRPHAKVKVTFDFIKGGKRLESYIWEWEGKINKNISPQIWDNYSISLTTKDSIYITIGKSKFEKPFFLKTGEICFIQNLEIRYNEFRFDYDPANEGKGYMKKMKFYLKHGKNSEHLEITIFDEPVEIKWFAYKFRFIKDVQEFVQMEVIRNE